MEKIISNRSFPRKLFNWLKDRLKKMKRPFINFLLRREHFSIDQSILLFGEVRGGTTWLMEMLGNVPGVILNFEPLHGTRGVVPVSQNWYWRPFLPKNHNNPEDHKLLEELFTFQRFNWYTNSFLKFAHFNDPLFVLTKMVRGNQALPYVATNMDLKHRPILLIRHPIPTCISFLKAFGNFGHPENWKIPPLNQHTQRSHDYYEYLTSGHSDLAYRIAEWCVHNAHILPKKEFRDSVIVVFYEDLLINPEKEMEVLIDALAIDINKESFFETLNFRKASASDFKKQFNNNPEEQLFKGFDLLSLEEKHEIQAVFDHFGFRIYDAYSPYPKREFLYSID